MIDPVQLYKNRYYLEENLKTIHDNLVKNKEEMKYKVKTDFLHFINLRIKHINKIIAYSEMNENYSSRMMQRRITHHVCYDLIKEILSGINEYSKKNKKLVNAVNVFRHNVLDVQTPILIKNFEHITSQTLDLDNYNSFINSIKTCLDIYVDIANKISILDSIKDVGDCRCC